MKFILTLAAVYIIRSILLQQSPSLKTNCHYFRDIPDPKVSAVACSRISTRIAIVQLLLNHNVSLKSPITQRDGEISFFESS